jgi:beta-N-acetylhexosaminidase
MKRAVVVLLALIVVTGCVLPTAAATSTRTAASATPAASATATTAAPVTTAPEGAAPSSSPRQIIVAGSPSFGQMLGQKLVVRMDGQTPSADLLGRIRRGEVGGIILFGSNITTASALKALTAKLRAAAAAGGQPRLLIAVDQEGGSIKRIPWAPPTISPPKMGTATVARAQGASTGAALRDLGIDVDFAPVADVPASTDSFMYKQGRTFSFNAQTTATLSDAFASGLESEGVLPTMKHFPGLGYATQNTDTNVVTITASKAALAPGLLPYRTAIGHGIPLIMLSNATYTAYDSIYAAGWSHAIAVTLLRDDLGFKGVTITDSLDGTGHARGLSTGSLAIRAARDGTDMILLTGSEASTRTTYDTLLKNAISGALSPTVLRTSYDRILALKAGL